MKTKRMKKMVSVLMASAMLASLCACTGGNTGEGSQGSSGTSDKLTVAIWDSGQKDGLDEIIKDYTEATGVSVEVQVVNWDQYWTLLEAGATGGELPDVFWMHSNEAQKYMENDMLLDLTDRIASSQKLEMDKFPQDLKDLYTLDGKTYAIPKDMDTIALWYNKTMFDEAGIEYPNEDWTWDDYYDAAVKLTKKDGSQYGTTMGPSSNQDGWENMVYSMGGKVISDDKTKSGFDDPNTIKAMEYVEKLIQNAMPPAATMSETGGDVLFQSGKVAMCTFGSWMIAPMKQNDYVAENCAVAVLPKDAETGRRVSIYNGLGWAISAGTENPDAAWELVEWFGSKDGQTKQAELGVSLSAYDGVSDGWKNNTDLFDLQPYLDMREDIVIRPYSKTTVTWENKITEDLKEAKVWGGSKTMKDVCAQITTDMNQILAEENQ